MKKHKYLHCTCNKQTDPRCQFHNKLKGLLAIKDPSKEVQDTINDMQSSDPSKQTFRRDPFSVEEILERRVEKNKGARPRKALTHNPFEKLAEMRD